MSVTFSVTNLPVDWDNPATFLNVANGNARDLLHALGIDSPYLCGEISARDLLKRIALARETPDTGRLGVVEGNYYNMGREPGRLTRYLDSLQGLCQRAGDLGRIYWG